MDAVSLVSAIADARATRTPLSRTIQCADCGSAPIFKHGGTRAEVCGGCGSSSWVASTPVSFNEALKLRRAREAAKDG